MKWIKSKLHEKKASSEMVVFLYVLPLMLAVVMILLAGFAWMMDSFKLKVVCDKVTRSIEVTGLVDDETYSLVDELMGSQLVVETEIDANYYDESAGKIQLRDTFTVTMTSSYSIPIVMPMSGENPLTISLPLSAVQTGMSEIFWG